MAHAHSIGDGSHRRVLSIALAITVCFMVAEAIIGFVSGSLVLVADAGHMLTDAGGLILALTAIWLGRRPANERKTYGYYRTEILAALLNVGLLVAVSLYILVEAARRVFDSSTPDGVPIIIVASIGLCVNVAGAWLLANGSRDSLNVRAAFLDMISDVFASIGAIVAGVIILTTGWRYADPLVAAAVAIIILPRAWSLLRSALDVLLEGTPDGMAIADVQCAIVDVGGVRAVHDLHVWTVTSGFVALSGHVEVDDNVDRDAILIELRKRLRDRFGIEHVTIQIENERLSDELEQPCFPGQRETIDEGIASARALPLGHQTGSR